MDAGLDVGIGGVRLQLFAIGSDPLQDTPISETLTQSNGFYQLVTREVGDYFIHMPASEFQTSKPLQAHVPVPGFGLDDGADDNADENTLTTAAPDQSGVNSIQFTLAYGVEPKSTGVGAQETGFKGGS